MQHIKECTWLGYLRIVAVYEVYKLLHRQDMFEWKFHLKESRTLNAAVVVFRLVIHGKSRQHTTKDEISASHGWLQLCGIAREAWQEFGWAHHTIHRRPHCCSSRRGAGAQIARRCVARYMHKSKAYQLFGRRVLRCSLRDPQAEILKTIRVTELDPVALIKMNDFHAGSGCEARIFSILSLAPMLQEASIVDKLLANSCAIQRENKRAASLGAVKIIACSFSTAPV